MLCNKICLHFVGYFIIQSSGVGQAHLLFFIQVIE